MAKGGNVGVGEFGAGEGSLRVGQGTAAIFLGARPLQTQQLDVAVGVALLLLRNRPGEGEGRG